MAIDILGESQRDIRTDTRVIYVQSSIQDYLNLVGNEFYEFNIQRGRQNHPAYPRMRRDIAEGALLPTITLAASPNVSPDLSDLLDARNYQEFIKRISVPGTLKILDGLQRTYILDDLSKENHQFVNGQSVHLEIRLEHDLKQLIYRIIVLNSGQKPMSMRHQVEILFSVFKGVLEEGIPGLELVTERGGARRTRSRKYSLERMATGYHAYILRSTEFEKQNLVAQQIAEATILEKDEQELGQQFDEFKRYLRSYAELDDQVCRVYNGTVQGLPTGTLWFGNENVMNSYFAAVSDFGSNEERRARIDTALRSLAMVLSQAAPGDDPLGLAEFQRVIEGTPVRKTNVGHSQRRLIVNVFREFFRDEGETSISELWRREAE